MAHMDIFQSDAFNTVTLSAALERAPFRPGKLLNMPGLYDPAPVRTRTVSIEERKGVLKIIQTSNPGDALEQRTTEKRNIRDFRTTRVAKGDRIMAEEIQGVREFGSETELMQVMDEVMRRYDGPFGIQRDVELTFENMLLGMVQGVVKDADGSTLYNWYDQWGITQPTEVNFQLNVDTTKVRTKCQQVRRSMQKASQGSWIEGRTQAHALCGDDFFDKLIDHPDVRKSYEGWQAAQDLRGNLEYESFPFAGIVFHNYRGTDNFDGGATAGTAAMGIKPNEAKFFPTSAPGVFQHVMSPAEFMPWVNTPGRSIYGLIIPDTKRQAWVDIEAYSYPLFLCTNPGMLQRARAQ